jgi:hypothetical protein
MALRAREVMEEGEQKLLRVGTGTQDGRKVRGGNGLRSAGSTMTSSIALLGI